MIHTAYIANMPGVDLGKIQQYNAQVSSLERNDQRTLVLVEALKHHLSVYEYKRVVVLTSTLKPAHHLAELLCGVAVTSRETRDQRVELFKKFSSEGGVITCTASTFNVLMHIPAWKPELLVLASPMSPTRLNIVLTQFGNALDIFDAADACTQSFASMSEVRRAVYVAHGLEVSPREQPSCFCN